MTETDNQSVLRREALLPGERNRGLGTVAVVCTMAGVASGLALATTLMAMQVADSMAPRPYDGCSAMRIDLAPDPHHGFLGVGGPSVPGGRGVMLDTIVQNSPADVAHFKQRDIILAIDGQYVHSYEQLHDRIYNMSPGTTHAVVVMRDGNAIELRPTLISIPRR